MLAGTATMACDRERTTARTSHDHGCEHLLSQHEVHVGKDLGGRAVTVDEPTIARYEAGTGGPAARLDLDGVPSRRRCSSTPRSIATSRGTCPTLIGNLHARQEWELFAPLHVGRTVRTRSTVVER